MTGFTTDICVAFTAANAYMRDYRLWIPSDCTAAVESRDHNAALSYMERVLEADIRPSIAADPHAFKREPGSLSVSAIERLEWRVQS